MHRLAHNIMALLLLGAATVGRAAEPAWWTARNVMEPGAGAQDYAPAVLGQAKWIASNAFDELNAVLIGGAGSAISNVVQAFTVSGSNYVVVNVGQLKNLSGPFYDRLIQVGFTNAYPWAAVTNTEADYAIANIGQLKCLFGFRVGDDDDADTLYDWWEVSAFGGTNETGAGDYDLDGLSNSNEYQLATLANDADTDNDGMGDGMESLYGYSYTVSNSYTVLPFIEPFETPTVSVGDLSGQNGWVVSETNRAMVQSVPYQGSQGLLLQGSNATGASIYHQVGAAGEPVVWLDFRMKPVRRLATGHPSLTGMTAIAFYLDSAKHLVVRDGSNQWTVVTNHNTIYEYEWTRFTVRADYITRKWWLALNGQLIGTNFGLATNVPEASQLRFTGPTCWNSRLDSVSITAFSPAGTNTLSGTIAYDGIQTGPIRVLPTEVSNRWTSGNGIALTSTGTYSITGLWAQATYWLVSYRDSNTNDFREPYEASGVYPSNPISFTGDRSGVNITLADPRFSISGSVTYSGSSSGNIHIIAVEDRQSWATTAVSQIAGPGDYSITNAIARRTYWVKAFRDVDGDGAYGYGHPVGYYASNPIVSITQHMSAVSLALLDDGDADSLGDLYETGTGSYVGPTNTGTSASNEDSDGDGFLDGIEVLNRTDPSNADTLAPTVTLTAPSNNFTRVWWP